jgi:hypothetical protein
MKLLLQAGVGSFRRTTHETFVPLSVVKSFDTALRESRLGKSEHLG